MTGSLGWDGWALVGVAVVALVGILVFLWFFLIEVNRSQALRDSKYLRRADQFPSGLIEEGEDQWADGIRYPKPANLNKERE